MRKIILFFMLFLTLINPIYAVDIELTDIIKQAREAGINEQTNNQKNNPVKSVKNSEIKQNGEQNACEKINPKEIISSKN